MSICKLKRKIWSTCMMEEEKRKNGQATSESQPDNHGRDVLHSATPRVWRLLPLSLGDDRALSFILPKPLRSQQAQNLLLSEDKNSNKC